MKLDYASYLQSQNEVADFSQKYQKKAFWASGILLFFYLVAYSFSETASVFLNSDLGEILTLFIIVPISAYFSVKIFYIDQSEKKILQKLASDNDGTYTEKMTLDGEMAAMFKQGKGNRKVFQLVVFSDNASNKIRLFRYHFSRGSGRNAESYHYLVFGVSPLGRAPHLYLNYRRNRYTMSIGQQLSLPREFEKEYTLSVPEGYQLEALQIFTPDVLGAILDLPLRCDIEFVNGEVLFFLEYNILPKRPEVIEREIEAAKKVVTILRPKFNNLRWSVVGDKAYHM
jgi:hypothetical protein